MGGDTENTLYWGYVLTTDEVKAILEDLKREEEKRNIKKEEKVKKENYEEEEEEEIDILELLDDLIEILPEDEEIKLESLGEVGETEYSTSYLKNFSPNEDPVFIIGIVLAKVDYDRSCLIVIPKENQIQEKVKTKLAKYIQKNKIKINREPSLISLANASM